MKYGTEKKRKSSWYAWLLLQRKFMVGCMNVGTFSRWFSKFFRDPKRLCWANYCIGNDLCIVTDDQVCVDKTADYLLLLDWREIVRLYYGADKDLGGGRKTLAAGHCQRIDRIKDLSWVADSSDKYKYCFCYLRICSRNPDCIQPCD